MLPKFSKLADWFSNRFSIQPVVLSNWSGCVQGEASQLQLIEEAGTKLDHQFETEPESGKYFHLVVSACRAHRWFETEQSPVGDLQNAKIERRETNVLRFAS